MDLSRNKFRGRIPDVVGKLNSLIVLNFSHNGLIGHIPLSLENLTEIESLDLSSNKLDGKIPGQLTSLTFLSVLNLSYNQLAGPIPQGNQFNTFQNDSYFGNLGLCGSPLSEKCSNDKAPDSEPTRFPEEHNAWSWFDWKIIMMGYGSGIVIGLSMGYIVFSTGKPWWFVSLVERKGSTSCSQDQSLIKVGTWGGSGGCEWSYVAKGGITEIEISSGWITIDWSREYLTSISGTNNNHYGRYVVESLYFYTNLNKYGPFGGSQLNGTKGIPFNVPLEDREIVGFYGRACDFIDAIGVYRKGPSIPIVPIKEGITMNMDLPREVGPWGGNKGKSWDDGLLGGIQQIDVHVGNGMVHAIQCRYHRGDGNLLLSNRHGGGSASTVYKIELEKHSYEYLVGITGFYGPIDGNCCLVVVRSVSFYTNKGKYGPFGSEIGTFFNSPVSNAKVVGFHGRSGEYLDAIGVHVEYS
ncbi:hypothetical protein Ddye_027728 [Dipteronia dyeriana]|uniref:Jacalin-type lectin domain-containing protein n=1 Tax=Dipteronia dyeriana TaxID=168575 RepID=A0AAD9WRQ2_9ROSI|nr:hypothetical protein Ddye_027728 [Dipteronia dyeriana]